MFSSMFGPMSVAILLAAVTLVAAAVAEGRGLHFMRLVLGVRSRTSLAEVLDDVPRDEGDWDLIANVNSVPHRPAPTARAAAWASEAGSRVTRATSTRASALLHPDGSSESAPRSTELGLARQ